MRKRLICLFTTAIVASYIYGCAKTPQNNPAAEMETAETESENLQNTEAVTRELEDEKEPEQDKEETASMLSTAKQDMFTYIINDNNAVITGLQEEYKNFLLENISTDSEITIPDTLGGCPVIEIGDRAFENIGLKNVSIPASVEKIGNRAFAGNRQLIRVNFWSGDIIIENEAFDDSGDELLFFIGWNREKAGKEVEAYAAANDIQVEYSVSTQINLPSKPLLLTPETGSFFYGELGGTYDDWEDDMWCSFEKTPDAPNFGFEDWQWPGCSKWCHIITFANQAAASSELYSASGRYCAGNVVCENRELAWAEGTEGAGIGEYIIYDQIVFSGSLIESTGNNILRAGSYGDDGYINYSRICIVNGYAKDTKVWQENGRVKTLMMYVYDQPYARLELEDTINPQYFTIPEGDINVANGEEVTFKFVIEEVYPGTMYDDTCITGIIVDFENVPEWH